MFGGGCVDRGVGVDVHAVNVVAFFALCNCLPCVTQVVDWVFKIR